MLFERTFEEILSEAIDELSTSTVIRNASPGSKARAVLEVFSRKLNRAYKTFDVNLARSFVSGANGEFLDFIGELLDVPRLGSEAAQASAELKAVRFFVEDGTFGSINAGSDIFIDSGTIISTQPDGQGIRYRVTTPTVLPSSSSSIFVAVEATLPGTVSNVSEGQLNFHLFTDYQDVEQDTLQVTNDLGIFTGADVESDTNYRFRISQRVTEAEAANFTAVRLAALSTEGVADMVFLPFHRGIGTFDILIKAITPTVSDSLLNATQQSVAEVSALGILPKVRRPREVGLTFDITLRMTEDLPDEDITSITTDVRNALTEYVNTLDIGEEFIINEAVQRVLEVDNRIKDMGRPNKPFDNITIHKSSRLEDNKLTQTLIKNYITANDERVIIEPSVANPITISTVVFGTQ